MKVTGILKQHKLKFFIIMLLIALTTIGQTFAALYIAAGINFLIDKNLAGFLTQISLSTAMWLIVATSSYFSSVAEQKFIQNISLQLRDKALSQAYESVENSEGNVKKAKFINMGTTDILTIETGFTSVFALVGAFIGALSSIIALFYYSVWFVLASVVLSILLVIIPKLFEQKINTVAQEISAENEKVTKATTNLITGVFDLFNYQAFSLVRKKNEENSIEMKTIKLNYTKVMGIMSSSIAIANILSQLGLIGLAGFLAIHGFFGFGVIMSVGNLASQFFSSVSNLSELKASIVSAQSILGKFSPEEFLHQNSEKGPDFSERIKAKDLTYHYADRTLQFPNMNFEKNKKYLIKGESGSGKTTFINILSGSLKNYQGSLIIDQQEFKQLKKTEVLKSIVVMSQQNFILDGTIKDNICLAKPYEKEYFEKVIENSRLKDLIRQLPAGIDTLLDNDNLSLSGGQIQRIAIARALYHNKKIIIFDEGTSNLDSETAIFIEKTLLTNPDKTVIIVSHTFKPELEYLLDDTYLFESRSQ